uniref:Cytochrome b n=1 Tax=Walchia hayashii TaxID=436352 RepID=B3IUK9_9ACAR|nr:cytochrome b [Walchia hayashii]BAG24163.1 cytochrome b protein [Walchia hayashii]
MKNQMSKLSPTTKMASNSLVMLPTPTTINYAWNMGSMLGMIMIFQIITGIFLSMHYSPTNAFDSVIHISRDVKMGIESRFLHSNGASLFFILIYTHIARGLLNMSFKKTEVWMSGNIMILILMGTAFLGYVLPWGQMSFWGATVITNLASAIPILGEPLVQWLWGGFSVSTPTLNRFFSLHFLLPFVLMGASVVHLMALHLVGSSNPMGTNSNQEKIKFSPFFIWKDAISMIVVTTIMFTMTWKYPYMLMDPENFSLANPMNTPIHIQPEWYFLFAYALLRSIPNKLGGVIVLILSIVMLMTIPMKKFKMKNSKFNPSFKMKMSMFFFSFVSLTWLGAMPMEPPYMNMSKTMGPIYFATMLI